MFITYIPHVYLGNKNIPKLGDLVVIGTFVGLSLFLSRFEAAEKVLVEAKQLFYAEEELLQLGVLDQLRPPQLVHVDLEKDLQGAHVVHLRLDEL